MNSTSMNRRELLKLGVAAGAGIALAQPSARARAQGDSHSDHSRPRQARNVIFMVSDGMSPSVPGLAEAFSQLVRGQGTNWVRLAQQPSTIHGSFDMTSLNSLVTDSAAAASAWGSGQRVNNNAINTLPDGTRLPAIGSLAHGHGRKVGLVTTTRVTHATPAGFAAAVPARNQEDEIASQYLDIVDVLLGGGGKHFHQSSRADQRDLHAEFLQSGYTSCHTREQMLAVNDADRIVGLFAANHLPYTIDSNRDPEKHRDIPTLAEMAQAALKSLSKSQDGFLLQIEGARVDHAAHNNDAAAMLWDQLAFDDAIGVVAHFCKEHPETVVVITSDHGCGNPGLNGYGNFYEKSDDYFQRLKMARASLEAMQARWEERRSDPQAPKDTDAIIELLQWGTGLEIDPPDAQIIHDVLEGKPAPEINRLEANIYGVVAQIVGNRTGIGWTGITHTADWTPILAFGPGSERFAGLRKATDAFHYMVELLELA